MKSFGELLNKSESFEKKNFLKYCREEAIPGLTENEKTEVVELNKKLKYEEHEFPIIFIGMGTCGLASGAGKVKIAIEKELEKFNLNAIIVPTGCIGYCAKEVIVDIKLT